MNSKKLPLFCIFFFLAFFSFAQTKPVHVWEMKELSFHAQNSYSNPYKEVTTWVELKGPGFSKRIYGFWDGGDVFRVRIVATAPGSWSWTSGSNQTGDKGLNNQSGSFTAIAWSEADKKENPNRHGFVRPTPNGHAIQYADGTPFFMVGDTWLAAATYRLPFRGVPGAKNYTPGPGIGFEDAVTYRKQQGFNSVSMISCFPNWEADSNANTYANEDGIYIRNAWEKFDYPVRGDDKVTGKDMRDEYGNKPFKMSTEHPGVADFDNIIPAYFQSLDKKMQYLSDEGFTALLETVRRDNCPAWKKYFDFNESYSRFVQYLISRYGAYNIFFSGIHLDWIPKEYSLTADEFNEALTYHLKKYGPLPYGQPHTVLIDRSTYKAFGHAEKVPWLTMHSVGNKPRDHGFYAELEEEFNLKPVYPTINFEPYYTGWNHEINKPNGERPPANSERDNYFSRAQMYGSVLSGGLSGHVHGTAAYDITTTGEPEGMRPHFWDALKYESANYMQHLRSFILSEGKKYQQLQLAYKDITPQKAPGAPENGLDGWSYMMRTPEKDFALLYFENKALIPTLSGFMPNQGYSFQWYHPKIGKWEKSVALKADGNGVLSVPKFPNGINPANADWAAKILLSR